ncbi:nitrate reductase [Trichoderma barbatum]
MSKDWVAQITEHPGATLEEIQGEPDWNTGHSHRIGFKNHDSRRPGFTGEQLHEELEDETLVEEAKEQLERLRQKAHQKKLINFRDVVQGIKDFHLVHPALRPLGWRYVLESTEDGIKYTQEWPSNLKRQQNEISQRGQRDNNVGEQEKDSDDSKEHESTPKDAEPTQEKQDSISQPSFLQLLQQDGAYIDSLEPNNGLGKSPQAAVRPDVTIDEADQFTSDNWFPRSSDLIRVTGSQPMNAEPPLTKLLEAVVHQDVRRVFSMEDLTTQFPAINIPVFIACDGNRRKELNQIQTSKSFNFGPGAGGCAYWKGVLLRDVLLDSGVEDPLFLNHGGTGSKYRWVNFEGSDELPEGRYSTCIPLEYAMDPRNDVLLAFQMNDHPLPPDHGYPLRVVVPGYVGGRCVKWLKRIWTSEKENDAYYHIWDNRLLPSFITDNTGELAEAMFHHPSTVINEQTVNSMIVKPAHNEEISLSTNLSKNYRMQGIAYSGGGRVVKRVEISLDGGNSWLYCFRKFPRKPIRHVNKFWTWVHWYRDVPIVDMMNAKEIAVRCVDASFHAQPDQAPWNIMGMLNNGYYKVRMDVGNSDNTDGSGVIICQHPVEPGSGKGGWMKPSVDNLLEQEKLKAGAKASQKQLTREEIEKHDKEKDCWIVVDKQVYDATSVLSWHPGGPGIILSHAGRIHPKTTEEFDSIHDTYAREKLSECMIGTVTEKVAKYLDQLKDDEEQEQESARCESKKQALQEHRWTGVKLIDRKEISPNTRSYTFKLPQDNKILGLQSGQHIEVGFHMQDKMLIRPYTPTRPVLPPIESHGGTNPSDKELRDGTGTFDLTIKTYFPSQDQPGGAMSNILDTIPIGEEIDIRGPRGEIIYHGHGKFNIEGKDRTVRRISFVMGGTGITPGFSIISRIIHTEDDDTEIRVLGANKAEEDILLREEFEALEQKSRGRMQSTNVLSHPSEEWKGLKGVVTKDMMKDYLFSPSEDSIALVCGPPPMIKKAVIPGLTELGYVEDENIFGF